MPKAVLATKIVLPQPSAGGRPSYSDSNWRFPSLQSQPAKAGVVAESIISAVLVVRGSIGEAGDRLARRLELLPTSERDSAELRARLLNGLGRVHYHAGEHALARQRFLESLALLRGGGID